MCRALVLVHGCKNELYLCVVRLFRFLDGTNRPFVFQQLRSGNEMHFTNAGCINGMPSHPIGTNRTISTNGRTESRNVTKIV